MTNRDRKLDQRLINSRPIEAWNDPPSNRKFAVEILTTDFRNELQNSIDRIELDKFNKQSSTIDNMIHSEMYRSRLNRFICKLILFISRINCINFILELKLIR